MLLSLRKSADRQEYSTVMAGGGQTYADRISDHPVRNASRVRSPSRQSYRDPQLARLAEGLRSIKRPLWRSLNTGGCISLRVQINRNFLHK
jgi:hypothetical protein